MSAASDRSAAPRGLRVLVLGAAAGGGSPQWNCRCEVCEAVREGRPGASPRTQSSVAVSADGRRWALLEASPDLPEHLRRERRLWPRGPRRGSPVAAVVVTDADIDHVAGLLTLRERHAFGLYGTRSLLASLRRSPIFGALDPALVERRPLALERRVDLVDGDGAPLGVWVRAFAVPGKVPLWAEHPTEVVVDALGEDVVGLEVGAGEASFFFVPSCAAVTPELVRRLEGSRLLLFDGTVWEDDELRRREIGTKTGRRMGHQPIGGADGSLNALRGLERTRRVFIHLNNSNPVLLPGSDARREVEAAGWEVAYDGMQLEVFA